MYKTFSVAIVLVAVMIASSVYSQKPVAETWSVSAYGGYSFGLGELYDFDDNRDFKTTTVYGLQANLKLSEAVMLGCEVYFQTYKVDSPESSHPSNPTLIWPASSVSWSEANFLINVLFNIPGAKDDYEFAYIGGIGLYNFYGLSLGASGGIVYEKHLSKLMNIYFMPRLHFIFDNKTPKIFHLVVGVKLDL